MKEATQRQLFFNQPADQWAVTHLLQLRTRDQLHLALHLLGMVSTCPADHRALSLARVARDLGYSRQTITPLKDRLVAEQLLIEMAVPGSPSLFCLGPAIGGPRYLELVDQYKALASSRQLHWPFNGPQRSGAASTNVRPAQSERAGTCSVRVSTPPAQSERATPAQSERAPIETSRECSHEISLESEPPSGSASQPAPGPSPDFPSAELQGVLVERWHYGEHQIGYISLWSPDEVWISIVSFNRQNIPVESGDGCSIYRYASDAWDGWSLYLHEGEPITFDDLLAVCKAEAEQSCVSQL